MRSTRWGIATLAALAGCYDLRGGQPDSAASVDLGSAADIAVPDVVDIAVFDEGTDAPSADLVDAAVWPDDADASQTFDALDAALDPDVVDAAGATDVVDVPVDMGPPPCPSGQTRCDDACVDTAIAPAHCGACGASCPMRDNAAPTCVAGACRSVCNAGYADCDNDASNGCEAALDRAESCGACGTRCQGGTPLCQDNGGRYGCVSGCSGAAGTRCGMSCVDPQTDVQHCGACDRGCAVPPNGRATCAAGTCGIACNMGYHACGAACADDGAVATCGTRCTPCPSPANVTPTCAMGACGFTCNAGFADCDNDASNGCEVNVGNSIAHCGRCGNACPVRANATATCAMGACASSCNTGFADCDGDAANGCEVSTAGSNLSCSTCASGSGCAAVRGCGANRCSPALAWTRYNGSTGPACAAVTPAGTVVSGGTFRSPTNFGGGAITPRGSDVFVVAHNRDGSARWHRTYGGSGNDDISRIALDADGNIYACGSFSGTVDFGGGVTLTAVGGSQDSFVLSLSPSGTLRWVRALGGTGREVAQGISVGAAGHVVVSGVTESGTFSPPASVGPTGTAGGMDGFVVAFDRGGTHQWTRLFGGSGIDGAYGVGVGPSGEVAVAAQVASNVTLGGSMTTGDTDAALIVYDPGGSVRWVQRFAIPDVNYGRNAAVDASGNIAFLMESEAASMGVLGARLDAPGHVVASFTPSGERRWARSIVGAGVGTSGFALSFDPGGGVLWSHYARDAALVIGTDALALGSGQAVVAFDGTGALRWARRIDGESPWCVASGAGVVAVAGLSGIAAFDDNATCTMGACSLSCGAGLANCDGEASNGCEADLTSPASCGSCNRQCDASQTCAYGECVSPTRSGSSLPDARTGGACAWTGSEFLVWGGATEPDRASGTGSRYDPLTDRWSPISAVGAPSPRVHLDNSFLWTGRELFVWGGADVRGTVSYDTGGLYDPSRDAWTTITSVGAPTPRGLYAAQWTGSEVVLWGGWSHQGIRGDGRRFDPRANRWSPVSSVDAPTPRESPDAVWTGTEFIVWGGRDQNTEDLRSSARYNPANDTWRPMSTTGAPTGRHQFSMVWTGREVLVWGGGRGNGAVSLNDGARYDPVTDRWTPITQQNAPSGRQQHATAWTGSEMIVWGGFAPGSVGSYGPVLADAAAYDPANDRWRPISGAPVAGAAASCTQWTGSEMQPFQGG